MAIPFDGSASFSMLRAARCEWPVFVLGRRFSALVAIQPGHEPVTNGSYGFIRHPRHRGMIILMLG